jgi:predicted Zn-dependent protease with MMP-like domain
MTAAEFQPILDEVFARIKAEPWFRDAENYVVVINETDAPADGEYLIEALTEHGGWMPTQITYYLRNIDDFSVEAIYRLTKHEFAHLWGLDEADAYAVEG